jgi:hypothetical protein
MNEEQKLQQIINERRQIRKQERNFRRSFNTRRNQMNLYEQLKQFLPKSMLPGNIGDIDKVTWPFWYTASFDLGINPTLGQATKQVRSFQVSNEAAFLLMAIGRKAWDASLAGDLAPLQIDIRDRQSSRQFNDRSIPIQQIGKKYRKSVLPTPMLIYPNAFIDVTMSSWLTADMATVGNGKHEFYFFGYRIRGEDMTKMLSSVFGG